MPIKKITFIAVNYNSSYFTLRYLDSIDSLRKPGQPSAEIIVVDNASVEEDVAPLEKICRAKDNVRLIRNTENMGYFKALNVGLASCDHKENSLCIVGNNDLAFQSDFLQELTQLQYDARTLAIVPDVITPEGNHQNPHYLTRMTLFRRWGFKIYWSHYYLGRMLHLAGSLYKPFRTKRVNHSAQKEQFIHMAIGAIYVLTEHFFRFHDRLDDRVFLWGEESLFANQVSGVGGRILYTPRLVVHHAESASVSRMPTKDMFKLGQQSYQVYKPYL